jgi:hypothetical protein
MFAQKLAGLLVAPGFGLLILSAFLGSALFGDQILADWPLVASQVCIWLAASVFLGYFYASMCRRTSSSILSSYLWLGSDRQRCQRGHLRL